MDRDLTIIIVNWNTRDRLRDCLASLPEACHGLQIQTLVIDNASHDGSPEMVQAEFPHCRLLESGGNLGFTRGNNLALGKATSRQILLLNPDTVCPSGSLTALSRFLDDHEDAAAVGPLLVDATGAETASYGFFPQEWHHLAATLDPQRRWLPGRWRQEGLGCVPAPDMPSGPVDYVKGACLLMRRSALERIGVLDEQFFMYFEESDWCRRAWLAGYRILLCNEVAVAHLEGRATRQVSFFSLIQFQLSYRLFITKHYGRWRLPGFRLVQFVEYGLKGLLRSLSPRNRQVNRSLARSHFATARLQLRNRLFVQPPG
ncbi:MAG: glycosyltransferase family 2 protein [bacterium]